MSYNVQKALIALKFVALIGLVGVEIAAIAALIVQMSPA